jgi:hypothetical protein
MGTGADITPGVQLPELTIVEPPMPDDGPVLIRVSRLIGNSPVEADGIPPLLHTSAAARTKVPTARRRADRSSIGPSQTRSFRSVSRMSLSGNWTSASSTNGMAIGTRMPMSAVLPIGTGRMFFTAP